MIEAIEVRLDFGPQYLFGSCVYDAATGERVPELLCSTSGSNDEAYLKKVSELKVGDECEVEQFVYPSPTPTTRLLRLRRVA